MLLCGPAAAQPQAKAQVRPPRWRQIPEDPPPPRPTPQPLGWFVRLQQSSALGEQLQPHQADGGRAQGLRGPAVPAPLHHQSGATSKSEPPPVATGGRRHRPGRVRFIPASSPRSCWRKWRSSTSELRLLSQTRCPTRPSCRPCWTWGAVWMWSCRSCRDSNRNFSRPGGWTRWVHSKKPSIVLPEAESSFQLSCSFLGFFHAPGSRDLG